MNKEIHSLESKLLSLKSVTKTQSQDGNWNKDEYMRGLANGLIMAEAIMDDKNPKYFEASYPEKNREEKYPVLGEEKMESECQMSEESINIRNKELAKRYKKLRYETVKIVIKGDGDYSDDYWEEKLLSFLQEKKDWEESLPSIDELHNIIDDYTGISGQIIRKIAIAISRRINDMKGEK